MTDRTSAPANVALLWRAVLDQSLTPMALVTPMGRCVHVNRACVQLFGSPPETLATSGEAGAGPPDELVLRRGDTTVERRLQRADGSVRWVTQCVSLIGEPRCERHLLLVQFHEIEDPFRAEQLWLRVFANAPNGMGMMDLGGRWTAVNDALCELLGYSRDEMLSMRFCDVTYPADLAASNDALAELLSGWVSSARLKKRYRHRDGHPIWVMVSCSVVPGPDGSPASFVVQCEELSERCAVDPDLAHLALHDPLTGLANRALFTDRLEQGLAQLARDGGVLAVLVADVDCLKPVNDGYGHAVGDQLLIAVADQLLTSVGTSGTVARIGGDEFAVVSHVPGVAAAERLRERITRRLDVDRVAAGHRLRLRASVGLATAADPCTCPKELMHRADRDMYRRKRSPRGA
ncbi:hypothetical protein GCM10011581_24960 [Saccharopolyspora subtropica]|uniref:PAS domain S-box-containing protein/diguanylate cyclase (GGDEF)-like protein n=1 Tax=Saccharopolyspora thermophila TaxID=89367 RepID=A0A917NDD3_9PSEU|nr:diguanylate cyclase [Saccharopolyspora subtropica]GGI86852.1 hypothetical protein GCM10011581_24960 [Saccharopolyspora subtropica]